MKGKETLRTRAEEILDAALDLPAAERKALLDRECAGEPALRDLVERMLSYAEDESGGIVPGGAHAGDLWDTPAEAEETRPLPADDVDPQPVEGVSGRYRLFRKLGEGGMGEVFEAEQTAPVRRRVAVKIVKRGMDSRQVVARFEAERQALALMDHPNVARVFDAGTTHDGRPFFAMELVPGEPITAFCDHHALSLRDRLRLFMDVCDGVQHAHRCTIIHRDLKPSNILVAEQDGRFVPKIIDFGVAKATVQPLTEKTLFTALGQFVGTPAYMSPEQADLSGHRIDTRTDVYSLGAVLYELLVGVGPLDPAALAGSPLDELLRTVQHVEPPRPSTRAATTSAGSDSAAKCRGTTPERLPGQLRGDLDWITMKALEKDRERRYGSPADLAADIGRFLRDEAITARPPSTRYRVGKFVRRHTLAVGAGAAFLVLLLAFAAAMTVMFGIQRRERAHAVREAAKAEQINSFLQGMLASADPLMARGADVTVVEVLDQAATRTEASFADEPEIRAAIQGTIGRTYGGLGQYDAALAQLQAALATRRAVLPAGSPEVLESLRDCTEALSKGGHLEEAEALAREGVAASRKAFGEGHVETALSTGALAEVLAGRGQYEEAAGMLEGAYGVLRAAPGQEVSAARLAAQLAGALYRLDRRDEAEARARDAINLDGEQLGESHPETIAKKTYLANILQDQGKYEEAVAIHRQVLESVRQTYPEDHPVVAIALSNLGNSLESCRRFEESAAANREALEIRRRALPPEHPDLAVSLNNLGVTLKDLGRYEEAERVLREALSIRRKVLGPEHPQTLTVLNNLANTLSAAGRLADAELIHREALESRRKIFGPEHSSVATSLNNLAYVLRDERKYAEAETMFREALAIRLKSLGPEHPNVANVYHNLGLVQVERGDLDGAEASFREALSIYRAALGNDHPDVARPLGELGALLLKRGDPAGAAPLLRESLTILEAKLPADHPRILQARQLLETCLAAPNSAATPARSGSGRGHPTP